MTLGSEFFTITDFERRTDGFCCKVVLSAEHPVYGGHFPAQAVVPGVCTLIVIRECAGVALGRDVVFAAIRECKFVSALLPCDGLTLVLNFSLSESLELKGSVSRFDDAKTVLKLKAELK